MKNTKLTDKTDNYRILSVYIDNIMRKTENHEQQTRLVFDCYTIVIVRSGKIHIEESGQQMILRKGDAVFFEKGKMAIGKALKGDECWIMIIQFDGEGVPGMLQYLHIQDGERFNVSGNVLAAELDSMIQTWEAGEYFRASVMLQSLFLTIHDIRGTDYRSLDLNTIYEYIQEHYAEPLDLNSLSHLYGTSVSYFSRAFKQHFGTAPMTFVNEVRMHYARLFLTTTEMKVQEIAGHCGFEKMEYFCYVFKKVEGCTPSQYRLNRWHTDKNPRTADSGLKMESGGNL